MQEGMFRGHVYTAHYDIPPSPSTNQKQVGVSRVLFSPLKRGQNGIPTSWGHFAVAVFSTQYSFVARRTVLNGSPFPPSGISDQEYRGLHLKSNIFVVFEVFCAVLILLL